MEGDGNNRVPAVWVDKGSIGEGGFGVVKLFVNEGLNQQVVLKECRRPSMNPEFVERWLQELDLIKRLRHTNIVQAIDLPRGIQHKAMGGIPFICMEFCEEGDLRKVLRNPDNCCGLQEEVIRRICGDINTGIRFLHSQKVIHRDLKPENILIKRGEQGKLVYKLTDFGYSKSYDLNSMCTSLVGTMQYVAPEVMQNKKYHSSVDFWSFGVVVFECIAGRRPFLHGSSSNSIAWVDYVSKKSPDIIHIYFSQDGNSVSSSSHLPQPHRLSKNLEALLTSWLQTALHYDPEKRGNRRRPGEDAVCLSNMDHILSTKMINTTCMSTAKELSFNIDSTTTYDRLSQLILEQSPIDTAPDLQFLVTVNGKILGKNDVVLKDMVGNIRRLYVFNSTLEPSFRLMQTSNQAVTDLTAYGDGKFPYNVLRELYSQVFFHIKENLAFFKNLHEGQAALLDQINQCCEEVRKRQLELVICIDSTTEVIDIVTNMHSNDLAKLEEAIQDRKVQHSADCSAIWRTSGADIESNTQKLEDKKREAEKIQNDSVSYFAIAKDLQSVHYMMDKSVEEYNLKHVKAARDLYIEIKNSKTRMVAQPNPSMQDILLLAQGDAQSIIERCLNGRNYGQVYLTLCSHRDRIIRNIDSICGMKEHIKQLNETRRSDIWDIITASRRDSPSSSLFTPHFQSKPEMQSQDSNEGLVMAPITPASNQRQTSAVDMRRQFSSASASSIDSICDIQVSQSLVELQRRISEEDNTALISKNESLRSKYQILVRSQSAIDPARSAHHTEESTRQNN